MLSQGISYFKVFVLPNTGKVIIVCRFDSCVWIFFDCLCFVVATLAAQSVVAYLVIHCLCVCLTDPHWEISRESQTNKQGEHKLVRTQTLKSG